MHASGICPCCGPTTGGCPSCGCADVSYNGFGPNADLCEGQPDTPLICESCGHTFTEAESLDRAIA